MTALSTPLELHDFEPQLDDFRAAVLEGLGHPRKQLPCKFFYDERGSALFNEICQVPEYYPTRVELAITRRYAGEIAAVLGQQCVLVEYGSGSSLKTRVVLDHLKSPAGYVPIDISRQHLLGAARSLSASYPRLRIMPVCADYTTRFTLPRAAVGPGKVAAYFPGSTIGNFEPAEARTFLAGVRATCGEGSGLLIGVDLKKDPRLLHAAYNDAAGTTARFNLNLLSRINRELDGDFVLGNFAHYAFYNPRLGRVEMHLLSLRRQIAYASGTAFTFDDGESIFTESCYKYTLDEFRALATEAGYRVRHQWLDDARLFSVQYLEAF